MAHAPDLLPDYLGRAAELLRITARDAMIASAVALAIDRLAAACQGRKPILVCGNGGSAADAMHIAGELVGRFLIDRKPIKAYCLGADPAVLTAWSNDRSFDNAFARQVEAYGEPGGVLWALSTSGNSRNVLEACETARTLGMTVMSMTGAGGGRLAALSDILIAVPSGSTPEIQQVHIHLYHFVCQELEARIFKAPGESHH